MPRRRQKQLGPAPLASFDRGLSSECNSFDEGLSTVGQSSEAIVTGRHGHIGVLCQTSIMEEHVEVVKTRSVACQTDRSALRDGVKAKQRKTSQSQTSFDQEPLEPHHSIGKDVKEVVQRLEKATERQEALHAQVEHDRNPSPHRPSTLDLLNKQNKKSPTNFQKVQKLDAKTSKAPAAESKERKRSLLGKKLSVTSASSGGETKSRSSSFRSPFGKKREDATSASSRSISPMLQVRQRLASLSPGRKKSVAKSKLEALLSRTAAALSDQEGSIEGGTLSRERPSSMILHAPRSGGSHSLSPKPSKKQSHAVNKLQALIDRTRFATLNDHEVAVTTHADVHVTPGGTQIDRRRSKSPPEPQPFMQHRLSLGQVWSHHTHGHHPHTHGHPHGHDTRSTTSKSPTSSPPSPFEVTKKFSIQEDNEPVDSEEEQRTPAATSSKPPSVNPQNLSASGQRDNDNEEKVGETLLADEQEEDAGSVQDVLDKVLRKKAQEDLIAQRKKVQDEREKRMTFKVAPIQRPRAQIQDMSIVDLNVYVEEAEKHTTHAPAERIKLNLHLNQESFDDNDKKDRHVNPDDWKRFCQQGLLTKRRRLEHSKFSQQSEDEWADFDSYANAHMKLPIPMIVETAWTPQEHRILNITPSASAIFEEEETLSIGQQSISQPEQMQQTADHADIDASTAASTELPEEHTAPVIVVVEEQVIEPASCAVKMETSSETATASTPVPTRKAPGAPVRKAPAPPPVKPREVTPEPEPEPEPVPEAPAVESWDPAAGDYTSYDYNYQNGYYEGDYSENHNETQTWTYPDSSYQSEYYEQGYYPAEALLENNTSTMYETYRVNGPAVAVVLSSQVDVTGGDVMADPSAIDIGNGKQPFDYASQEEHAAVVESSPLLEEESQDEDAATVIWNPNQNVETTEEMASFQPLTENEEDIDFTSQSKHRKLSKVPYTSLDIENNPDEGEEDVVDAPGTKTPEEEAVTPLLENADVVEDEGTKDELTSAQQTVSSTLEMGAESGLKPTASSYDQSGYDSTYDPAVYDPAATGYDINSQEYYDYYYGSHSYQADLNQPYADAESYQSDYPSAPPDQHFPPAPVPSEYPAYEYHYSYQDPAQVIPETTDHYTSNHQAEPEWPIFNAYAPPTAEQSYESEPKWPTFNAYVPPATESEQVYQEESSDEEQCVSEVSNATSVLPKERLFDTEETVPFGNLRPELKKKDTDVIKVAKGLKPSKKKIVNLITKGKYSSGKKKDVFEEIEIETEYNKMIGVAAAVEDQPSEKSVHSASWQEYQNMTARVQETVGSVMHKTTPLQTPTSPSTTSETILQSSTETKKPGPPSRPPPPKAKPSRPPPPSKKTDVTEAPKVVEVPQESVVDELADFLGAPIPAQKSAEKVRSSSSKTATTHATKATTEVNAVSRPKAGSGNTSESLGGEVKGVKSVTPAKKSNVDDLLGLFDEPLEQPVKQSAQFETAFEHKANVAAPESTGEINALTTNQLVNQDESAWGATSAIEPAATKSEGVWDPWGSPVPAEPSTKPPLPARPPPLPARPAPSATVSGKDKFMQSNSADSDATFAAAFGHTQDESPGDETTAPGETLATSSPHQEQETKVISQVESMVTTSETSPRPVRKTSEVVSKRNSFSAWGEEDEETEVKAVAAFEVDFENDPFGDNTNATSAPEKTETDDVLQLISRYKSNAPEKINLDPTKLGDDFFDPFATIVPEESPLPPQSAAAAEDEFTIWGEEGPEKPDAVPGIARRTSVNRKGSVLSNTSRRTSSSVQTPLFDEDDSQPLPAFTWDHPQSSWELLLRYPAKKTLTANRYWKPVHVKLTDTMLQLYNKPEDQKPFHELPLQGNYMIEEISIQPLDIFTKIHTTKLQYVFYKERVGVRPGQIQRAAQGKVTKLGLPLEHASQTTELLKFGSLNLRILKDLVHAIEDVLFRTPMIRERPMIYKQEEVQAHVIDEFTAKVDKSGIISDRKGRVRVYCLGFLSGMPEVEFGLNDIVRRGKEVVGRHDILPIYTEEWIRMEDVELHHCVSRDEYAKSKMIKFVPPDACFFELVRFRVRPPKNRELPLAIKVNLAMEGYRVNIRVEVMTTGYYNRKRAQPCDDIQIRVPIPEQWIYLFRTEKLFGYGAKHASSKRAGLIKGMSERLRTAGSASQADPSLIEVSCGQARYEHVFRSLVWRISRLPKEGQGAFATHVLTCRLDLNSYDTMPERFEPNSEVEFTMPAATASHTTLRSISTTCDEPPEKWVKYLAKYEYQVEIDYKIDRGEAQLYTSGAVGV